jgi:two-component system chemotaxis response regulator CheY
MAKVMIVDDSAYARRTHRSILERAGHVVVDASTGTGAIETFSLERPNVVLLDLSMEDFGGLEVLRTLRTIDSDARIVVVSADVQRTTEKSVIAGGAERFLPKPVKADQLLEIVAELAGKVGS